MCRGVVFIAQERGPKFNPYFRLGCNWKDSCGRADVGPGCRWRLPCLGQGGLPLEPHHRFRFLFWVFGNGHPAISWWKGGARSLVLQGLNFVHLGTIPKAVNAPVPTTLIARPCCLRSPALTLLFPCGLSRWMKVVKTCRVRGWMWGEEPDGIDPQARWDLKVGREGILMTRLVS